MSEQNPWKTLSQREVYRNPWIRVREDQVLCPNGEPGIYGVVEAKVATGVVALTLHDEVYLIGQYRYPIERYSWEIVEGGAELDEDPRFAAARELQEEAGLVANEWQQLGADLYLSNCFSTERAVLYLARDLREVPRAPEGTEQLEVQVVPFAQAFSMMERGEINDAMSVIALYRTAQLLKR